MVDGAVKFILFDTPFTKGAVKVTTLMGLDRHGILKNTKEITL